MEDVRSFELKVGVFILIGVAILFLIVFSIGDINFSKSGYTIGVEFNFANGLAVSAPVRLAGVRIGQVQSVRIGYEKDTGHPKAEITAWVDQSAKIEKDSKVTINQLGLLGEKYLEIMPGTTGTALVKPGDKIVGHDPVSMEKITENLANLSDDVKSIVERLRKGEGTIGKLLVDEKIYNDLEAFVADIKAHPWKLLNKPRGE